MATYIANADAALTGAATWGLVNAASLSDLETGTTASTTAYVESSTFTPGAVTIDGIAVKVGARAASPTGTISIRLAQAGALVVGTEVTINVSDIDARAAEQGWYFFKFAAPVLLVAATLYTVSMKTSVNAEVSLYRGGAGNWSRMLRTTTAGTLAAGDNFHIMGEWTAAATKTNRAVTMDSTANTDYGDNTPANPPQFTINKGGTLTWNVAAATQYQLRLSGKLWIYSGGVMTMGTTGSPVPRDSSHLLNFDVPTTDGDFGLVVHGTFTAQGQSRTAAKIFTQCKLNTDEAAAQTVLGVDTDTGWLNADEIGIAPTTRTVGQNETRVLNGNAAATTITVTAGLTNAHSGTSPTQAEVILLTRNVRIESVSTTLMAYCLFGPAAIVDCDWVSFRYMGANVTGKRGVEVTTESTGSMTMDWCSIRNFDRFGVLVTGVSCANFYIRNCVAYLAGGVTGNEAAFAVMTNVTSSAWEVSDCTVICGNNTTGAGFYFESLRGVVQRINASAGPGGIFVDLSDLSASGTLSDWVSHSNTNGIQFTDVLGGRVNNLTAWRHNGASQQGGIQFAGAVGDFTLDGVVCFGNGANNISFSNAAQMYGNLRIRDAILAGDTTFSTAHGFSYGGVTGCAQGLPVIFENCTFGVVAGIHTAHTTADVQLTATAPAYKNPIFRDCLLASATEIANSNILTGRCGISYQKKEQVNGVHMQFQAAGTIEYDTSTFHTAAPSEKLTPTLATAGFRLRSQTRRIPVSSGDALAVSVWVRKSAAYVGSAVRLLMLSNAAIGLDDDVVVDTMTAAADTWEQLTGTLAVATDDGIVELVIECDGAAGVVYADDWAAAVA